MYLTNCCQANTASCYTMSNNGVFSHMSYYLFPFLFTLEHVFCACSIFVFYFISMSTVVNITVLIHIMIIGIIISKKPIDKSLRMTIDF